MNHNDHVNLLRNGVTDAGKLWADFGSGSGAFTLAFADLLGSGGEIHLPFSLKWCIMSLLDTLRCT